jgi:hypothetical protein
MKERGPAERALGRPLQRVDARLKVTGEATFAAETRVSHVAHAVSGGRLGAERVSGKEQVPEGFAVLPPVGAEVPCVGRQNVP